MIAALCYTLGFLLAVGGNPVIRRFLRRVQVLPVKATIPPERSSVFRGGAWIGILERAAIYICVVSGFPTGIAVVLAVKGLGRYPELHNEKHNHVGELFIIGTFVSALWALAAAGLAILGIHLLELWTA